MASGCSVLTFNNLDDGGRSQRNIRKWMSADTVYVVGRLTALVVILEVDLRVYGGAL